ncbi:hypothetical protein GIB67_040162 [Kingdonia uniflora]|uniref:Uncharacterized protein n=1 Tax=Kingdonia uniflora TaxID=39325 RepID=A0A7J7MVC8_9MAGN|nr:hypothetical protein GIB67_040162 [Kingdonia uniflora]
MGCFCVDNTESQDDVHIPVFPPGERRDEILEQVQVDEVAQAKIKFELEFSYLETEYCAMRHLEYMIAYYNSSDKSSDSWKRGPYSWEECDSFLLHDCDRHTMEDFIDENWSKVIGEESPKRDEDERIGGVPLDFPECSTYLLSANPPYKGQHFETVEDTCTCKEKYERGQGFSAKKHNSIKRDKSKDVA